MGALPKKKTVEDLYVEDVERRLVGFARTEHQALNNAFFASGQAGSPDMFEGWYKCQPVEGLSVEGWLARYLGRNAGRPPLEPEEFAASYRYYLRVAKAREKKNAVCA